MGISEDQTKIKLKLTGPGLGNRGEVEHTFVVPLNGETVTVDEKDFPFVLKIKYDDSDECFFKGGLGTRTSKPKSTFVQHLPAIGLGIATLAATLVLNFWAPVRETAQASGLPQLLKQYLYPVLVPILQLAFTAWVYLDAYTHKNKKEAKA